MSIRKTIARNTIFNMAGRAWEAIASLVLTPYIVWRVGLTEYGMWGLVASITGYVALADLGLGSAYAKYIAEHAARKDNDGISSVVSTGFYCYLGVGAVLLGLCIPTVNVICTWLARTHDAHFVGDMRFLLIGSFFIFAASNCMAPFSAIQTGLQRMEVTNILTFVTSLVKIGATVFFLERGNGVRGLLYANVTVFVLFAVAGVGIAFRLVEGLRITTRGVRWSTFRSLFNFGWRSQIARLSNLVTFETDALIIGLLLQRLDLVGLYKVGVELANKMRQLPIVLLGALMPAAADLDARNEHERLQRLYLRATKYLAAVTIPLVLFTVGAAGPIMRTWMGPGYETSAWVLRIIAFGYIGNILPGAGVSVALGKGRADLQMYAGLLALISNVALTIALYYLIGFWGIPIGTAASMFITTTWFLGAMSRVVDVGAGKVLRFAVMWPTLASMPGLVICVLGDVFTRNLIGRASNAPVMLALAVVFAFSYLILVRRAPFLDSFDLDFLDETLAADRVPGLRGWVRSTRHG